MKEREKEIKVLALTEEGYDAGFRLAGCITRKVKDEKELSKILEHFIENSEFGVILVEESLYQKIEERKRKKYEELSFPLIIGLNLKPEGRIDPEEYIRELTKRAIGYSLKIK
ncbi:MAG: V-type ATP synthase subunit F [candidate division WOR-3 bacterium]